MKDEQEEDDEVMPTKKARKVRWCAAPNAQMQSRKSGVYAEAHTQAPAAKKTKEKELKEEDVKPVKAEKVDSQR